MIKATTPNRRANAGRQKPPASTDAPTHNRGLTTIFGVVLVLALTVIGAAAVGTFFFGQTTALDDGAPDARITFDQQADGDALVRHAGGTAIPSDALAIHVDGAPATLNATFPATITAGDTAEVKDPASGARIELVYTDGDHTAILATWEVP